MLQETNDVLTGTSATVRSVEGTPFTGLVASFTDSNPARAATDFTATITWGDGNTSAGAIAASSSGGFDVTATNTYAEEGTYAVMVTIVGPVSSQISIASIASVSDAALTAGITSINATEGTMFAGAVATFDDANHGAAAGDFTASINWGDGTLSAGTVSGSGGSYSVAGSHTYVEEGNYSISIVVSDVGGSTATITGTAAVADAILDAFGISLIATEGVSFTGTVATFMDTDPNPDIADLSAAITWGDGHVSTGISSVATANTTATVDDLATRFSLTTSSNVTAGSAFNLTVTVLEADGDIATGYTGTVHFTSSDTQFGVVLPADYTFTAADAGVHTFTNGVTLDTAGDRTVTVTDIVTSIQETTTVTVSPAAAASFVVAGYPSSVTAGSVQSFTVTAKDSFGNTVPGYLGTVAFSTTALKAVLPASYTFTSVDAGSHVFSAIMRSAGPQTITITDTINSSISASQSTTVNPATTNHLIISRFPSKTVAGVTQTFRVTAQDAFGNTTPSFTDPVTFGSTDSQALLPADYTFTSIDAGVHTFSVTLKTAGSESITVQDASTPAVASGTQSGIIVSPTAANRLQVAGFPLSVLAGSPHNFTITALDSYGNVATGYRGTVSFTSNNSQPTLPANYTFTSADAGVRSFSATLNTVATNQSISATDIVNVAISGMETGIGVVSMQPTAIVSGPAVGVPGQPLVFTFDASESGPLAGPPFTYTIDWGDHTSQSVPNSGSSSTVTARHTFTAPGSFIVRVTASDPSGNASLPASAPVVSISPVALETDPYDPSLTALYIGGTPENDTIAITPALGGGVKVGMNFVNYGSFFPTGRMLVYSQSGNDIIKTAAQTLNGVLTYVSVPVLFLAGNGKDILNASGSSADNVLVGGGGADRLIGGLGRDILIGGSGASTLQAGSRGDILIAGSTSFDDNAAALAAVLAEWSRSDLDYLTRIAHLTGSLAGGLNGPYALDANTVHDNGKTDSLYSGPALDWYFAGMMDVLVNKTPTEVVTPV